MVDRAAPPQRLHQGIGETQRHQVLHGLFAEVVIDAKDIVFPKVPSDLVVDLAGRIEILPDRLLEHDARVFANDAGAGQVGGGRSEQRRQRGQVKHADVFRLFIQQGHQAGPTLFGSYVLLVMVQACREAFPDPLVEIAFRQVFPQRRCDQFDECLSLEVLARRRDNAASFAQLPVRIAVEQRGQQLALREIAGPAENDEIEGLCGYELGHSVSLPAGVF